MTGSRAHPLIAVGCVCSAIALGLVLSARAQTKPPAVLDNPLATLSLEKLSATRDRPLFSPSRRAPRPPVVASSRPPPAVQPPAPPPNIELHGTILNADETLAIVFSSADNQTMRVHLGDEIGGWKVAAIEERKLVLSLNDRTAEFALFAEKNANDASASEQQQQNDVIIRTPLPLRPGAALAPVGVKQQ